VWKKLFDEGKLKPEQALFWRTKPVEELYDLQTDPDEINNLAQSAEHAQVLARLRTAQREHALRVRDIGFLPEGEIHARAGSGSPYEVGHDPQRYPFERVFGAAELASALDPKAQDQLKQWLHDKDSAVRFWAALGLLMRGQPAVTASRAELQTALRDDSPYVRVTAAEALAVHGEPADLASARDVLLEQASMRNNNMYAAMWALNALDSLGAKADPIRAEIAKLPRPGKKVDGRLREYIPRLLSDLAPGKIEPAP
jgi:uncharacterized sulfatase